VQWLKSFKQLLNGATDAEKCEPALRTNERFVRSVQSRLTALGKRGRPITANGALYRELAYPVSTLGWTRLAEIPKEQFDAYLDDPTRTSRELSTDATFRHFDKLSPDKPRPPERARDEAVERLMGAKEDMEQLNRKLLEVGSDEELQLLSDARQQVDLALEALVSSSAQAVAVLKQVEPTEIQGFLEEREADSTAE
jgi:hypothetical protein